MRSKLVASAFFLGVNLLVPSWTIAQPTSQSTQKPRCKALSRLIAPEIKLPSSMSSAQQRALNQAKALAKLSAHYAATGLDTDADKLTAQAIQQVQ